MWKKSFLSWILTGAALWDSISGETGLDHADEHMLFASVHNLMHWAAVIECMLIADQTVWQIAVMWLWHLLLSTVYTHN